MPGESVLYGIIYQLTYFSLAYGRKSSLTRGLRNLNRGVEHHQCIIPQDMSDMLPETPRRTLVLHLSR